MSVVRTYGIGFTQPGISRFHLRRKSDGACIFLYNFYGRWLCGLQHMKPMACKLWPFKILNTPKYGRAKEALCIFGQRKLYVYVDSMCKGLQWGSPTIELANRIVPEFVEIALGHRKKQFYSTCKTFRRSQHFRGRRLI